MMQRVQKKLQVARIMKGNHHLCQKYSHLNHSMDYALADLPLQTPVLEPVKFDGDF